MVETAARSVELLRQLGDTVLELPQRDLIATRKLHPLDLVPQCPDCAPELVRHALPGLIADGKRIRKRGDAVLNCVENAVAIDTSHCAIDLLRKGPHLI